MIDRMIERILQLHNPSVVGLDPKWAFIPHFLRREAMEARGNTPEAAAYAFYRFNAAIIDAVCDIVPAVKPQIAMYEEWGAAGYEVYVKTVRYAQSKGLIVIGDVKRSDVGNTAEAYSHGHIGRAELDGVWHDICGEDFLTVNPYLGVDGIDPFKQDCRTYDKGLFVLVKTSNPHSGQIQDLQTENGLVYQVVGNLVEKWGSDMMGRHGFSEVGAVVGATFPQQAADLRARMPHTFFLIPGYGAQWGKAEDIGVCFNQDGIGGIVNSSRGIIAAWQQDARFEEKDFALAAREAAVAMKKDLEKIYG